MLQAYIGIADQKSMLVVATGLVRPKTAHEICCEDLAANMAMVRVDEVHAYSSHLPVIVPSRPECRTLGQCICLDIKWPKSGILLSGTSTQSCPLPPATGVTPVGPSPFSASAPPTFENDGGTGTGGDMAVHREQHVGDTLPPQDESAGDNAIDREQPVGEMLQPQHESAGDNAVEREQPVGETCPTLHAPDVDVVVEREQPVGETLPPA